MRFGTTVLILSFSVIVIAANEGHGELPTYIIPCQRSAPDLNKCVDMQAKKTIPHLVNGDRKHNIQPLDPLILEKVDLKPNNQIILKLKKAKILGLGGIEMKGAKIDLKKRHIKLPFSVPKLDILGQYNMSGQIGIIPIHGQGATEIKFTDANIVYEFDYKLEVRKDNKTYFGALTPSIDFKVKGAHFWFDNLFDGNKQLSDSTHDAIHKNWQDVMNIFGGPIADLIGEIATSLIKALLSPVPIEKIFLP